ncbi:MAG: hypothetical protein KBD01_03050 [Acidobacteria bacterium]|nr:hypothetical protein [Acidobacteriota bacterium]
MALSPTINDPPRAAVLRLSWPIGATFAIALAIVLVIVTACEFAARGKTFDDRMFPESIGSGQPQLDKKLVLLRRMVEREHGLDCLFLGSSQVYRAIDPQAVRQRIRQRSGEDLRCFNFGLGGMSEISEAPLAEILLRKYRPRLVVVGLSSYGMGDRGFKFDEFLGASPWFQYQSGDPTLSGWLLEHSYAMRRYQGYRFRTGTDKDQIATQVGLVIGMDPTGHAPLKRGEYRGVGPETRRVLQQFSVSPQHIEGLQALLALRSADVEFLGVELPVHETVIALYPQGAADHTAARATIEQIAAQHGIPFWRLPDDLRFPADTWADFVHLNRAGTAIYSDWLGERLGEALRRGELTAGR